MAEDDASSDQRTASDALRSTAALTKSPVKAEGSSVAFYTLEEDAARRDAVGMASKPDQAPISRLAPLLGAGMLQPAAGLESSLYMPVERQEQVAAANLAVSFARLDVDGPQAELQPLVTDVVVVSSRGGDPPVTVHLGGKYSLVKEDLLGGGDGPDAPHAFLCVKSEAAKVQLLLFFILLLYFARSLQPCFIELKFGRKKTLARLKPLCVFACCSRRLVRMKSC